MGTEIGTVGVDAGMLLLVDPCYLFTEEEWSAVCDLAFEYASAPAGPLQMRTPNFPKAVLEVLAKKTGQPIERLAVAFHTHHGDGRYTVTKNENSFSVDA